MKSSFLIFSLSLLSTAFAASTIDTHKRLVQLAAAGNGIIRLDSSTFELLTSPKRTWSASVQFTALDKRRKCLPCKEFEPSWTAVAQAWTKTPKEDRDSHFFATLDFDDDHSVFQQLQLTSAPVVYVYPPADGPRKPSSGKIAPSKYDFSTGYEPGPLAESLSNHTPIPIPYTTPIDWIRWFASIGGLLLLALTIRFISPVLQNRWTWAIVTIITSLVMISGFMFTRIRNVPYTGGDGHWIAAGYQNQFGQEVHVLATTYGVLAFSFLMLIMIVPYQSSPGRQRIQVYIWNGVIILVYSVLVTLFRVKNRGYPFKLLL